MTKRRSYVTDRQFQLTFIMYSLMMACFVILAVWFGIYNFFRQSFLRLEGMGLPPDNNLFFFLIEQQQTVRLILILTSIIIFSFMGLFGLFLSHRVAGPLHRVKKQLKALAAGEPTQTITFRRNDYFQELADDINNVQERLKTGKL